MNELHLLQMAAKAGGLDIDFTVRKGEYYSVRGTPYWWNAGVNTKHAFDLADHLRLMIDMTDKRVRVTCPRDMRVVDLSYDEHPRMAINRLAILMIAAEIGEAMVD
jgi:hypothetical protein